MKKFIIVIIALFYSFIGINTSIAYADTWTQRVSGTTAQLNGVAYGNGLFVAVGPAGLILTSSNGITWTAQASTTTNYDFSDIVYGDGKFVAVGGAGLINVSTDGITWTEGNPGTSMRSFFQVTYGNGLFFTVCRNQSTERYEILKSPDGINWTWIYSANASDNIQYNKLNTIWGVRYGDVYWCYLAFGQTYSDYTDRIYYSNNQTAWFQSDYSGGRPRGITYGNNLLVAVGDGGAIQTSNNGASWYPQISGITTDLSSVSYGNGLYVAVGKDGIALTSPDGSSWSPSNTTTSNNLNSVTYGNDTFVAVGANGIIVQSPDTIPDAFTFFNQSGVPLNTVITSNIITISGIDAPISISITGGTYSINGGDYTGISGTVVNGDTVTVRLTSSASYSTTTATLTIGGVSVTFSVTSISDWTQRTDFGGVARSAAVGFSIGSKGYIGTGSSPSGTKDFWGYSPLDTTPEAFTFTEQTGVSLNTSIESNTVTVSGITAPVPISITGGEYSVSNDGGTTWSEYSVSVPNTVNLNDQVKVRQTSSFDYYTQTDATLTIGGVSDTFSVTTIDDTVPEAFTFTDQTGAALGSTVTFNEITVSGINVATAISISGTGAEYSVNGGLYTSDPGTVVNGDKVTVQLISSGNYSTTTEATLTIGGISDTFSVTTMDDTFPNAFTFTDQTNVALSTVITSNTITVAGIAAASPISITNGTYSINGGTYTSDSGTVTNGNTITVQQTSSGSYSTTTNAILTIGSISDTFSVTTVIDSADTTPAPFIFTDQTGAALSTVITSNAITVSGIGSATTISITGGTYSINGGEYTSESGTVNNGDTVTVQQTSSANYSTQTDVTLTIGGVSDTFSVTTLDDTTPEAFTFADQTGVSLNTSIESNTVTVSGITAPVPISITGGEYSVSNDGGTTWSEYSASVPSTVNLNDQVKVRQTSSSSYSTQTDTTLTIGGVSDTFSVTTIDDTTPDAFTFTDQTGVSLNTYIESNTVTVSGITVPISIAITDGEYSISTDNGNTWGSWTNMDGTVALNNQVKVRQTSSISPSITTDASLTIGGVSDTFSVTTKSESALGTIEIDPNPDSLNAPWTLTGPNAFSHSFNGDAVEGYLDPGEYTVTWGDVTGWDTPSPSTQTLAAGESITFTGTYQLTPVIPTPPTSGAQGSNITLNGSNFGSSQGNGYVNFNGIQGTIVSWSDTQIVVTVPYGATTGCMTIVTDYGTSGCIDFTVENPACFPPVKLSNYDYFNVVQDAYDNVTEGNAVLLRTGTFIENILLDRNISTVLQGGYNCPYDDNTGYTTIDGSLTIKNGTVTVEKLIIK